ncbi:MAG: hypothetical protein GWP10_21000, partial [Nitrospiraceae bacterium]|nr:hypothetical protein [Nitrospiraceae bacterium]
MFRKLTPSLIAFTLVLLLLAAGNPYTGNTEGVRAYSNADSVARGINTWVKVFYGEGNEEACAVLKKSNGNYIIAGKSNSFGLEDMGFGDYDILLIEVSPQGSVVQSEIIGGTKFDDIYHIQETLDKGLILLGSTKSFNIGIKNTLIIKFGEDMKIQWVRTFNSDKIYALTQTADDGFVLGGSSSFSIHGSINKAMLIKLDKKGIIRWVKVYNENATVNSIHQAIDGGFIMSGSILSSYFGMSDFFVARLDSSGAVEWERIIGGRNNDVPLASFRTVDGGYIVGGYSYSFGEGNIEVLVVKLNSSGDIMWSKIIGEGNYIVPHS